MQNSQGRLKNFGDKNCWSSSFTSSIHPPVQKSDNYAMLESRDQHLPGLRRCLQFGASPGYEVASSAGIAFRLSGKICLQAKKLIAAMPAKTRRLWTSYVTLVDRLCYPYPHGINLFISKLLQNVKSCVTPTPMGYDFLYQTQFEKISIENIIFML